MDEKLVQFAVREGIIDSADEVENLTEIDKDAIEMAYEVHESVHGRRKVQHNPVITNESGERVFGKPYWGYLNESYEEAMAREANEVDLMDIPIDECGPWDEYLPEGVDNEIFFAEMAEIYPKYIEEQRPKIKFRIVVPQGDEGPVPHLHMYFRNKKDKDLRYISFICLHKAEYAPQHEGKRLNFQERKAFIEFLNTFRKGAWMSDKDGNPIPCNCWQECVDTWINTHGDKGNLFKRDEDGMIIMPDYSELPTKG